MGVVHVEEGDSGWTTETFPEYPGYSYSYKEPETYKAEMLGNAALIFGPGLIARLGGIGSGGFLAAAETPAAAVAGAEGEAAAAPRATPRVTSAEVAEALAEAAQEHGTTTLYHGGALEGGAVHGGRYLSTTTELEYAEIYAERLGGEVTRFHVPTARLEELRKLGSVQRMNDSLQGTTKSAEEWRFTAKFLQEGGAKELNQYRVPEPAGP